MNGQPAFSPLFDGVATWLLEQGLIETGLEDVVQGMGQRLIAGGVAVHRLSIGGMMLHPVFAAIDITWSADTDQVTSGMAPRSIVNTPAFQDAPFFVVARDKTPFARYRLERNSEQEFPILERLRREGITDYLVFGRNYGRHDIKLWLELPEGMEGAVVSFATRRLGGFSDMEIDYLQALATPFGLVIKTKTTQLLSKTVLETYLGRYSGGQVLRGLIARGDGRPIDCVLWYCDLRGSTALAEKLGMSDYLETLDSYFDCVAGAVMDHGGEVLKFIGDAVMAIFPVDEQERPVVDMCRAALSTAREARLRRDHINAERRERELPEIEFGIALHVGQVMYGNVGTDRRLDFTVVGPAANEATRLEGLCKRLGTPVIASAAFNERSAEALVAMGSHEVAGVADGLAAFALPEAAEGC